MKNLPQLGDMEVFDLIIKEVTQLIEEKPEATAQDVLKAIIFTKEMIELTLKHFPPDEPNTTNPNPIQ